MQPALTRRPASSWPNLLLHITKWVATQECLCVSHQDIVTKMLHVDPHQRLTAPQVIEHFLCLTKSTNSPWYRLLLGPRKSYRNVETKLRGGKQWSQHFKTFSTLEVGFAAQVISRDMEQFVFKRGNGGFYFGCHVLQVLRHPWIVDREQLSDRVLTRQDVLTVKVRPSCICGTTISKAFVCFYCPELLNIEDVFCFFDSLIVHWAELSAKYSCVYCTRPAAV